MKHCYYQLNQLKTYINFKDTLLLSTKSTKSMTFKETVASPWLSRLWLQAAWSWDCSSLPRPTCYSKRRAVLPLGIAQARICSSSIQFLIRNKRKIVQGSPGWNLLDFLSNFKLKLKENWSGTALARIRFSIHIKSNSKTKILQGNPSQNVFYFYSNLN